MSVLALLSIALVQALQAAPPVSAQPRGGTALSLVQPTVERGAPGISSASAGSGVTFTPISANSIVNASILGSLANYNETDSSTALEPSLQLVHSVASGNISVHCSVSGTNSPGSIPPNVVVSTGYLAKTSGSSNDSDISYSYQLTFSLDRASLVSLVNGNSGAAYPRAVAFAAPGSASLTYTLRHQAGATVFVYAAPTTNSAGTYAQAIVPAGTYEFVITGAASAPGDPCCVLYGSSADGIVRLQFEDAPPPGPVSYCTAGTSASGCQASMSAAGTASATATSGFDLMASSVEGAKDGLFFFGTNGRQANPWGNGTSYQCVVTPVKRGGLQTGSGTPGACDGTFSQDLNALWCPTCPKPLHNPGSGTLVQAQLWYRDPFSTASQTTSLSDAIEFLVAP